MKSITYPLAISIGIVLISMAIINIFDSSFSEILHQIKKHPIQYGIISLIVLTSGIILPVPSSIVLYINGYFLGVIPGTLISISGLMAGCIIGYFIGKSSSNIFKSRSNQKADQILDRYGIPAIFLTRGIPIISESISFVAGYHKVSFNHYLFYNLIGYLPVCLLHAIFGNIGYIGPNLFLFTFILTAIISFAFWYFGKNILPMNELV